MPASRPAATLSTQMIVDAHLDLRPRVPLDELGQQAAEHERDRGGRHGEADAPRDLTALCLDGLERLQRLIDGRAGVIQEALPRVGEGHAPRRPREEGDAEPLLQLAHRLAQGGRRDAQVLGRRRVAQPARDRDERVESVERREGHREDFLHHRPALFQASTETGPQGWLTPRLRRTCRPGSATSFTIKSDTLFNDTSCPRKGSPFCVTSYRTS